MTRTASWFGVNVRWMKPLLVPIAVWLDDALRQGVRNPVKKWWLDMEIVDGVCVDPTKGVNQRDLNLDHKIVASEQKMAFYHADQMPPADQEGPYAVDRQEGMAASSLLETPAEAVNRRAKGGAQPAQYRPPRPVAAGGSGSVEAETTPWGNALKREDKRPPADKRPKL